MSMKAWRVDFNVGISSMEPLIAGTRNLVDFALSSQLGRPPRFIFASSIGVLRSQSKPSFVTLCLNLTGLSPWYRLSRNGGARSLIS